MSTNVIFNGLPYKIPEPGDEAWGSYTSLFLLSVAQNTLSKAGGSFRLTGEVDFGNLFGIKSIYYTTASDSPALDGILRLSNIDTVNWRSADDSEDLELGVDTDDNLTFNGSPILPSGGFTPDSAIISDSLGVLSTSITTATEIGYVNGVTSSIQTQLNGKQAAGTYIKADGTIPLSANWNAGAFTATFNSVLIGSAANTITALRTVASDTSLTFQTNGSTTAGSISTGQVFTIGPSGGSQTHIINGSRLQFSNGTSGFVIAGTTGNAGFLTLTGAGGGASGGAINLYGNSHASNPNLIQFSNGGTLNGSISAAGLVTWGAANSTQSQVINGNEVSLIANVSATASVTSKNTSTNAAADARTLVQSGANSSYAYDLYSPGAAAINWFAGVMGTSTTYSVNYGGSSGTASTSVPLFTLTSTGVSTFASTLNLLAQSELRLQDTTGGQYVGLRASGMQTTYTITLPSSAPSTGTYLKYDGANYVWDTAAAAIAIGDVIGNSPVDDGILYSSGGNLTNDSALRFDGALRVDQWKPSTSDDSAITLNGSNTITFEPGSAGGSITMTANGDGNISLSGLIEAGQVQGTSFTLTGGNLNLGSGYSAAGPGAIGYLGASDVFLMDPFFYTDGAGHVIAASYTGDGSGLSGVTVSSIPIGAAVTNGPDPYGILYVDPSGMLLTDPGLTYDGALHVDTIQTPNVFNIYSDNSITMNGPSFGVKNGAGKVFFNIDTSNGSVGLGDLDEVYGGALWVKLDSTTSLVKFNNYALSVGMIQASVDDLLLNAGGFNQVKIGADEKIILGDTTEDDASTYLRLVKSATGSFKLNTPTASFQIGGDEGLGYLDVPNGQFAIGNTTLSDSKVRMIIDTNTSGDPKVSVEFPNYIGYFGDKNGTGNGSKIIVDDNTSTRLISLISDGGVTIASPSGTFVASFFQDISRFGIAGTTEVFANTDAGSAGITSLGTTLLGDADGAANGTSITINDPTQEINITAASILLNGELNTADVLPLSNNSYNLGDAMLRYSTGYFNQIDVSTSGTFNSVVVGSAGLDITGSITQSYTPATPTVTIRNYVPSLNRSDNAAVTATSRVILAAMNRTITTSQTDTSAYNHFMANGGTITIPSGQTYTHTGTGNQGWAGYLHAWPTISGAGTSAIAQIGAILINNNTVNYGTSKYGVMIGPLSGSTNNSHLVIGSTSVPTGQWAINSVSTSPSIFAGTMTATSFIPSDFTIALKGTGTNNNATSGYVGEYVESVVSSYTNFPGATTVWGNAISISLTAGDWDVTGLVNLHLNGAVIAVAANDTNQLAISVNSGATTTDQVQGSNQLGIVAPGGTTDRNTVIPSYRISLSGTTTVYLKLLSTYTVASPQFVGRLSARRVR